MKHRQTARLAAALSLFLLGGCALFQPQGADDKLSLQPATFADLPGWKSDDIAAAAKAFALSCARITAAKAAPDAPFGPAGIGGTFGAWQDVCAKLPKDAGTAAARAYFEDHFNVYALKGSKGEDGLFTGYYEPTLEGTTDTAKGTPIYARPQDMVTVNLGDFKKELAGQSVTGRVEGEKLVPYHTRAAIDKGALKNKAEVIAVAKDPVDVFFLQVQGSGRVVYPDGRVQHVGYAAQNGHSYYAIGRELIKRGALAEDNVSMQAIRAWLASHPAEAAEIMQTNPSYVFFRPLDGSGPLGAEGVVLTPERSLAVDKSKLAYGLPVYLDAENPDAAEPRLQRLMVAQDTGGAIKGVVRGDFFWGAGDRAADRAGRMKSRGRAFILLPKTVKVPPAFLASSLF